MVPTPSVSFPALVLDSFDLSTTQRRILLTLAYSDQFHTPLRSEVLWLRLLDPTGEGSSVARDIYVRELERLTHMGLVTRRGTRFALGYRNDAFFTVAAERYAYSTKKRSTLETLRTTLQQTLFIQAGFLTGSLAADNATPEEDIDVFVVTPPRRLWLARLLLLWKSWRAGRFRSRHTESPDAWCLNMWCTTNAYAAMLQFGNIYHAYELCQMRPLYDATGEWWKVLQEHQWIAGYLPHLYQKQRAVAASQRTARARDMRQDENTGQLSVAMTLSRSFLQHSLQAVCFFLDIADFVASHLQRWYMRSHQTREIVGRSKALFHPRDTQGQVRDGWQDSLDSIAALVPAPIDGTIIEKAGTAREKGTTIVLATGVFDVLHAEHRRFLERAKAAVDGGILFVGVESDGRVREMKGEGRPINTAADRVAALRADTVADVVFILPESFHKPLDHERLIATLRPRVLAVSSHTKHLDAKRRILEKYDGTVQIVHEHNPAISTTKLLQKAHGSSD